MRCALAVIALAICATSVHADVRTEARRHFRAGMELLSEGRVDEGVAELQRAYDTLPHPNVLYNIARAFAEDGRYESAALYFERYLASDPPDREEVEAFLRALRDRIGASRSLPSDAPEGAQETTPGQVPSDAAPVDTAPVEASDDEIQALEASATQIEALAESTQSDSLRERARRLREVAASLRATGAEATIVASAPEQSAETTPAAAPAALELGIERAGDVYEETIVSASRFAQSPLDAPNATAIITRQDIRLTGLTNIGELIRRVAGADVMTLTPGDTAISFRGFNQRLSPRTLVLIDGRSVYLDPLGATFWSTLPFGVEDIERIEVIRGPASALYGADAFSGIVNIITRAPGEPRTDVTLGGGNGGRVYGHVATSGRASRVAYRVSAGYRRQDRYSLEVSPERLDRAPSVRDYGAGTNAAHANAGLRYRLSREAEMYMQGGLNLFGRANFQGTGPLRDFLAEGESSHLMAGLKTSWGSLRAFWNRLASDVALGSSPPGGDPLAGTFTWNTYDIEGELAREFHLGVDHNLHLGAAYRRKQIDWSYLSGEQFENHYALFFQDTLTIAERLRLVGSFRTDFHPLLRKPVFSPRGAMVIRTTHRSALRASVGTAFRTQTFLESYLELDNPTPAPGVGVLGLGAETAAELSGDRARLTPERILSAEVGYRNADSDAFDAELSAYYNRVTDLVLLDELRPLALGQVGAGEGAYNPATERYPLGTITFANDPTTYDVVGGEASVRAYPLEGLDVYANYAFNRAFVRAEQRRAGLDAEERTSRHKLNLGVQVRAPFGLDIAVDLHWASAQVWREQELTAAEGVALAAFEVPAYHLLNARVGWRLLDDDALELGVSAFNLTNRRIRQHPFGQRLALRVLATAAYHYGK